tara:strand:+ start:66 stop:803 length:738 start_codon:yes stop_codon:yes gene_type:complete
MTYFSSFPTTPYNFGDETSADLFRNITLYSDVIDQIRDESTLYEEYTILENERPDQLAYRFYNNADYHWTFYLMNAKLRERGWPLSNNEVLRYAKAKYPNTTITTESKLVEFPTFFKTGDTVEGRSSGASGKIVHKNFDLGQLVIDTTGTVTFITGENIETSGTNELVFAKSVEDEYLAAHHYESGGEYVDILNDSGVPSLSLTRLEKTVLDELHRQNDDLKQIKVIKNQFINQIVSSFKEALRS